MKQLIFAVILVLVFSFSTLAQNENSLCPKIEVVGGDTIREVPMFFSVILSGETKGFNLEYEWTISQGKIIEGQGSSSIKIDTNVLSGEKITATVKIKGLPENCDSIASKTGSVYICILPRMFDEYAKLPLKEEFARLYNLIIELQKDSNSQGFVLIRTGKNTTPAQTKKHIRQILKFIQSRDFPKERLLFGLENTEETNTQTKIWVVPKNTDFSFCEDCEIINGKDF